MRVVGHTLVDIVSVKLDSLAPIERKCLQCHQRFDPGDEIVVLIPTKYGEDDIISLPEGSINILHARTSLDHSCVEEFLASTIIVPEILKDENLKENTPKSEETGVVVVEPSQSV